VDVSDSSQVETLAAWVWNHLGGAQVLCNNAGVDGFRGGRLWEAAEVDWAWTMGVNFWGVVHGTTAFLPRMLTSGRPGHIVNTVSAAALARPSSMYGITKHAALAYTEAMHVQLAHAATEVGFTALLPDVVSTPFFARTRRSDTGPEATRDRQAGAAIREAHDALLRHEGASPDVVARRALTAILTNELYALTRESSKEFVRRRTADLLRSVAEIGKR
jgi:NAD(P)-dependent dehydrogenase (short-subunit alcohol dehydrogenase family)